MPKEILMPKLGMTMETGTILQWLINEGDDVEEGEPILEVMTDKINIEVESYHTGTILKLYYQSDAVVPVNSVIGYIGEKGEHVPDTPPTAQGVSSEEGNGNIIDEKPMEQEGVSTNQSHDHSGKERATPAARKLAREHGIQLQDIKGSGPKGRIHRHDVLEVHTQQNKDSQKKASPLARKVADSEHVDLHHVQGTGAHGKIMHKDVLSHVSAPDSREKVKIEGIRKVIGERMSQSAFTAPHVTLHTEVDMTQAIELRKRLLLIIEQQTGHRLSYTEIIVKAVSQALKHHPLLQAYIEGDYMAYHTEINIGLAVATQKGLLVPVIKRADQKGLAQLTTDSKSLAAKARESKLKPDEMSEGTFTISNLGMYKVDHFTPIINQPESAILGVGRILEKPVGVNGKIELRPMMGLSLSFDHRIIDGAPAAAFLTELSEILENPFQLLV